MRGERRGTASGCQGLRQTTHCVSRCVGLPNGRHFRAVVAIFLWCARIFFVSL